ncbi:MAG: type I phosphomannose isomerase catalytic subunit [Bryobacteraceae bacterium]
MVDSWKMSAKPTRLPATFKEKPWGSTDLAPWYPSSNKKIGEVWFEADLPLLVKFLFTSSRLSVQVHPDDKFAAIHENSRGKTEMWHILRAEPGAQIALGLRDSITPRRLRQAALSGEIVDLLNWIDVRAGETFFTPAGTVHAIGAGLALCEIQQHSDVTYRIYDYGSERELHLDKALQVCQTTGFEAKPVTLPVECPHFRTEALRLDQAADFKPRADGFELLIFHEGEGAIGGERYRQGETWLVPAGASAFQINPSSGTRLLVAQAFSLCGPEMTKGQ